MQSIDTFSLTPADFNFVGTDLSRPECVLAEDDGTIWVSDDRAAVTRIDPDGRQTRLGAMKALPNGLAMDRAGRLYIANIGDGRLYRMDRDGREEVILESFDGKPLASTNFVYLDDRDRLWITLSTATEPRSSAVQNPIPDGSVILIDERGARCVADGFHFTNEVRIDPAGTHLYVVETALGRIARLPLAADGSLGTREVYGPAPVFEGAKLDGIAFDSAGNLWATDVAQNSIVVITPDRRAHIVFQDPAGTTLQRPASIAFTGPDRRTALIGSLAMNRLAAFTAPVAGAPMRHQRR